MARSGVLDASATTSTGSLTVRVVATTGFAMSIAQWFIVTNTYNHNGPYNWSVQVQFDSNDGLCKVRYGDGGNTIDIPYETDRWVKIQSLDASIGNRNESTEHSSRCIVAVTLKFGNYLEDTGRTRFITDRLERSARNRRHHG